MSHQELIELTASEAVTLLKKKEISASDLVEASAKRMEEIEPSVNAMPIICVERARKQAFDFDNHTKEPDNSYGWLAGLPISVKDLDPVADVPFTHGGSVIYRDQIAQRNSASVDILENNGAITMGKSNSPEWGFNANTINALFGPTRNPYDTRLTVGGSSGGAAASVATGEVWAATGSDLGSSIRLPAAFCSVVGLRPSFGRIPRVPNSMPFNTLPVLGPIARTVEDVTLFFEAMVGEHWRDPLSFKSHPGEFLDQLERFNPHTKLGWSPDLGVTPVAPEVSEVLEVALAALTRNGLHISEADVDCSDGKEIFHAIRGVGHLANMQPLIDRYGDQVIAEVHTSVERAAALSITEYATGERKRGQLFNRLMDYFEQHDILLCPTAIMEPFPADWRRVDVLGDFKFDAYIDWIAITFTISLTGCPAVSLPCGFTRNGLPVGLQLIAKPHHEKQLLATAKRFQDILGALGRQPVQPNITHLSLGRTNS